MSKPKKAVKCGKCGVGLNEAGDNFYLRTVAGKKYYRRPCKACSPSRKGYNDRYYTEHKTQISLTNSRLTAKNKVVVLTHYGPNGVMRCSWKGCRVVDSDMLSIDHINDDGAKDRGKSIRGGQGLYCLLRRKKFPKGFQTLCYNHQVKKEILRRKEQREQRYANIQVKDEAEKRTKAQAV